MSMDDVLRLLRIYVLFRLAALIPTWAVLRLAGSLPQGLLWVAILALLSLLFVWIPGLSRRLPKGRFLSVALFLLITGQSAELTVTSSAQLWQGFLREVGQEYWPALFAWRGESFFYLLVPIVMAAWVYGRNGMLWAASWAVVTYVAGGFVLWLVEGALPLGYLTTLPPKVVILFFVPFLVSHLATIQRRQHAELKSAHARLQRQAVLTEQLATSRERNRLARELHDTLAHSLSGVSVQLQAADVLFDDDPTAARHTLQSAQKTVRNGLDEARRAIAALRASSVDDLGLVKALHRRLRTLGDRAGLETAWKVEGDLSDLDPVVEQTVYRVAEEALLNVERHAAAREIAVRLVRSHRRLTLTIHDDGQGFDVNETLEPIEGHFGIAGMRERAELLGGQLEIESEPGRGTRVRLTMEE
jgi:signal transduction histidine kinase